MGEKKLKAGDFVYKDGDSADAVYIVSSGQIEILEIVDGREIQTKTITASKVFGEAAVADSLQRNESARALEDTVVIAFSTDELNALLAKCPQEIMPILNFAFEKLKAAKPKSKIAAIEAVLEDSISKITIAPAGETIKDLFKPVDVPVIRLPFRIGGYPESGETTRRDQLHLAIPSQENPLRISRQHCEISIDNKALVLVDLGSRFNTKVNGITIGRGRGSYMAPLKKGVNEITLGAVDGPYKLKITCA